MGFFLLGELNKKWELLLMAIPFLLWDENVLKLIMLVHF